jgi:signal transduction histidine kinase
MTGGDHVIYGSEVDTPADVGQRGPWSRSGRRGPPNHLLPLIIGLVQVLATQAAAGRAGVHLDAFAYFLLIVGPAALTVRRRWRPLALIVSVAATTAYFTLGYPDGPGFLAAFVAILGALRTGYRTLTWVTVGSAYLVYVLFGTASPSRLVTVAAWLVVLFVVGEATRVRSAHFAELRQAQLERARAVEEQEKARAEHRRRQASEERLQIARELHDVLGHHLSLINVQAGVGLHLMDDRPEQARDALTAIKQASAEALREVRNVLAALRPDDEQPPRAPAPSLSGGESPPAAAGLRALIADVTAAGLPVELLITGTPGELPAEVDRAAYRIVQEALTNVRRHAGTDAVATVTVGYEPAALTVRVVDDGEGGPAPAPAGEGTGLVGMRERVEALGGRFDAGPAGPRGFEVSAQLPLGGDP